MYNTFNPEIVEPPIDYTPEDVILPEPPMNEVPAKPAYRIFDNVDWATS